jgi:hypothetical protein
VIGLLAGFPYTGVVLRDHAKEWAAGEQQSLASLGWLKWLAEHTPGTERAWKMAHLEGLLNGLCLMVVSAIVPVLSKLSRDELGHLGTAMAVTAYGNSVASLLCALGDVRGMLAAGNLLNRSANLGFGSGVTAILYALFLILKGSRP